MGSPPVSLLDSRRAPIRSHKGRACRVRQRSFLALPGASDGGDPAARARRQRSKESRTVLVREIPFPLHYQSTVPSPMTAPTVLRPWVHLLRGLRGCLAVA